MIDGKCQTRFIVVSGGVISGVGKGVASASIGKILQQHGYSITLIKIDPYINFDAGTLRPTEHGEVWVTADGGEIDQDLGTYERFVNQDIPKRNSITTGQIYKAVIDRERRGEYLGQTVEFSPHIINEIVDRIKSAAEGYEFGIVEIGGTVGDYENTPFLFAVKALTQQLTSRFVANVLVSYLPVPGIIQEMKTRPTRQAIQHMGEHGIMPDFLLCRATHPLDEVRKKKIQEFTYLPLERIISAPDITSVYQVPIEFERENLGNNMLAHFGLTSRRPPVWDDWKKQVDLLVSAPKNKKIAIVGKYLTTGNYSITDSYLSICHALMHALAAENIGSELCWIDAQQFDHDYEKTISMREYDGIIIPGGFGSEGIEGKINVITRARCEQIPILGICYGLQLMVIEIARNLCGLTHAHTTEVAPDTIDPIIDVLPIQKQYLAAKKYGGSMRLGAWDASLKDGSKVSELYHKAGRGDRGADGVFVVHERHRHRYEVNPRYRGAIEEAGLVISGTHQRIDGTELVEFVELAHHPFFVATQAHPEFTSRFGDPNPLFRGFVASLR